MAIALRNTSNVGLSKSTGGTLIVPVPTGTASGDILLIAVTVGGSSTLPATPTGLTALDSGTTGPSYGSWYRICDGTEPASYSFTVSKSASATARSYSGADTTTPINAHGVPNKTATASATATSITTTTNGCELVFFSAIATSGLSLTLPTGFANSASNSTGISSASCDETQASSGSTGTVTGTWSGANNNWSQLIALAPAAGGGSVANTLTASPGAMTITGDAITPPVAHKPTVSPGAMTLTGSTTTTPVKHAPTLNPGPMALSGHATLLPLAHKPTLTPGSVAVTGDATTLVVSHIFLLSVSPGAMSVTGSALLLPTKRNMSATLGTFTITGDAVTFTTATGKPALDPTPGPYVTGADIHGFNPFPGTARIPGSSCFTGPISQWMPYQDVMLIAYDYATQLFLGTKDKTCLQALAKAGIGGKV